MAMPNDGERQGLTNSFRSQTGYGTAPLTSATKKSTPKTRKFIAKKVLRTDTLRAISLKYAVSVQELKRENKLWNTDHLFLREEILIPLTAENEGLLDEDDTIVVHDGFSSSPSPSFSHSDEGHLHNGSDSFSSSSNGNGLRGHAATFTSQTQQSTSSPSFSDPLRSTSSSSTSASKDLRASSLPSSSSMSSSSSSSKRRGVDNSNNNASGTGNSSGSDAVGSGSTIGAAESSVSGGSSSMAEDFFSKYDTSIAQLRGDVEKMEKNAAKLDGLLDSNPLSLPPQALRRQSSGTSGYSRKGSAASLSSTSGAGGERGDRRSRAAALLLDEEEGQPGSSTGGGGATSGSTVAVVHAQSESPVLMIRSRSNNKQVKSAIENLRTVDDDLFEL